MNKTLISSVNEKILIDDLSDNEELARKIIGVDSSIINEKVYFKTSSNLKSKNKIGSYSCRNLKTQFWDHKKLYICNNPSNSIMNSLHSNKIEKTIDFNKALNLIEKSSQNPIIKSCTSLNSFFKNKKILRRYSSVKSRYQSIRMSSKFNLHKYEEYPISLSNNKSLYRSRSFDQFLESQANFLTNKNLKIAHEYQKQLSYKDKIEKNTPISRHPNRSTQNLKLSSEKRSSSLLCQENNQQISKKVKLSEFQKYVKENLYAKPTCSHYHANTFKPKIRENHQNILYKKLMKDIDKILVKNNIFSNQLTFTDMEIVFENLGFKSKEQTNTQSNALEVIWNSINNKGGKTICTQDLKIALLALSNITIPQVSTLQKNSNDLSESTKDSNALDSNILSKKNIASCKILQLNYIRRNKVLEIQNFGKSSSSIQNSIDSKKYEVFHRLTKKIKFDNSITNVIKTKNSVKLNLIQDKCKKAFGKSKLSQSFINLVTRPKFKILDKKPYMLLSSECTFAPNIS